MKKNCFINTVIFGTIIIAASIYVIQRNFDHWFLKSGKKLLADEIIQNWDKDFGYIPESEQKDSLKKLLISYVENIGSLNEVVKQDEKSFFKEFHSVIEDSIISEAELSSLSSLLKKEIYEKPKSN
jgi:hypothetical protein